ncbi:hypothetical protein [Halorhabdus rudnickae]|uniref:hypothetical protein n=1 Tax=Halorhabdus rudnickae TaxID=1775544 RepID=UPI0010823D12|nr:hypothetical protein [Halorhabdus rudnickae]
MILRDGNVSLAPNVFVKDSDVGDPAGTGRCQALVAVGAERRRRRKTSLLASLRSAVREVGFADL